MAASGLGKVDEVEEEKEKTLPSHSKESNLGLSIKVYMYCIYMYICIPPEEEALASKACEIQYCLFVGFILSKATENETNREVE